MYFLSTKAVTARMLTGAILILLLAACGNDANTSTPTPSPTQTVSTSGTSSQSTSTQDTSSLSLNQNQSTSFDLSSLSIKAGGFTCAIDDFVQYAGGSPVVTDPSASYDSGSIGNLAASIDQGNPSLLPNGFTGVLGAFVKPNGPNSCDSLWEVTNTGQDVVEITQIALVYTADSQSNTYHYNLIDICTLPIQTKDRICSPQRGGGSDAQTYNFQFGTGSSGTVVPSQSTTSLTLNPGDTAKLDLVVSPADTSNPNFVYSVVPQLTLSTSSQPLEATQMNSRIAFTDINQVSCYQLQSNNTFVKMDNPPVPYNEDISVECI